MKKFITIFLGTVFILFLGFIALVLFVSPYSKDQRKIIEAFGTPDSFEITMNVFDEPMMESWKYLELSKVFIFADKKFVESIDFEFSQINNGQAILNAPLEPKDVYYLSDIKALENKLSIVPEASNLQDDVLENAEFYNFANLVHAGVIEGKINYIKTLSFVVPNEEISTSEDISDKEIFEEVSDRDLGLKEDYSLDKEVLKGEKYVNDTFGFSLIIPDSWRNNYNIVEDFDFDLMKSTITFQYLIPSPYENQVQGFVDVFTIEAFFETPDPNEVLFSEFLGNNNVYFLYYSHFNGDIMGPDHPIWEFPKIIESIEIFEAAVG
ncbi:MAG: hypothetical protein RBS56_04230 [Candidatus Gracilibacteria bacterium]|jgi:hypothetical protein|nr:hypothetical protein [Candidatus Gracilibacteria bacterium]